VIAVLRVWFARPDADAPGWYRAEGDPVVGKALRLVHDDPARQWMVADPPEAGILRAAFARRFTEGVGEPPMALPPTGALAADLLLEPDATIGSVADQVGYTTAVRAQHRVQAHARCQSEAAQARRSRHPIAHPDATAGQRVATTVSWNAVMPYSSPSRTSTTVASSSPASPAKAATRAATAAGNRSALPLT
jgi:hypothetical protein